MAKRTGKGEMARESRDRGDGKENRERGDRQEIAEKVEMEEKGRSQRKGRRH